MGLEADVNECDEAYMKFRESEKPGTATKTEGLLKKEYNGSKRTQCSDPGTFCVVLRRGKRTREDWGVTAEVAETMLLKPNTRTHCVPLPFYALNVKE